MVIQICTIEEGQEYRRKLSDLQTSGMIKVAANPPHVRRSRIEEANRNMQFDNDQCAKSFGISIDSKMAQIKGLRLTIFSHYFYYY